MENETQTQIPQPRNFVIQGCSVVIICEEEGGIAVEELLGIVFGLANANPGAKVDFSIKVMQP